jgi:predicted short-subunit dehydrogenase-like oxidoreductase (DUF2520 family)
MFETVQVIGSGRAGSAMSQRLTERNLRVVERDGDLVVLCVPDDVIATVAAEVPVGPWIAHVSGATPLANLAPHVNRFSVHPLQTLTLARGAEQLDGAWGAVTGETGHAVTAATWLAEQLGLRPFPLGDDQRVLYHAGAVMACNYLVTLHRAASRLLSEASIPAEALLPLMQRTIDNNFELTGPIARGDSRTVAAHRTAIEKQAPELLRLYDALAEATAR